MDIRNIQQKREKKLFSHLKPAEKIEFAIELSEFVQELRESVKREYERGTKAGHRTTGRGKSS